MDRNLTNKSFTHQSGLIRHRSLHTGEKPSDCVYCGIDFTCSSSCLKHIRFHTGEKPFKCEYCGADFLSSSSFHRHQTVHTGERCRTCENRYSYSYSLNVTSKYTIKDSTYRREIRQYIQERDCTDAEHVETVILIHSLNVTSKHTIKDSTYRRETRQ